MTSTVPLCHLTCEKGALQGVQLSSLNDLLRLNGSEKGTLYCSVRMGCTVSFVCCEDDCLQMPAEYEEGKTKEEGTKEEEKVFKVRSDFHPLVPT